MVIRSAGQQPAIRTGGEAVWYTAEVGEVKELRSLLTALRNLDAVFDAYRVTPS